MKNSVRSNLRELRKKREKEDKKEIEIMQEISEMASRHTEVLNEYNREVCKNNEKIKTFLTDDMKSIIEIQNGIKIIKSFNSEEVVDKN